LPDFTKAFGGSPEPQLLGYLQQNLGGE